MDELRSLEITIRQIQQQLGETPEEQPPLIQALFGVPEGKPAGAPPAGGTYKPRADEFFGRSQADAAKSYLEKIGHAVPLDEILSALRSGGCKVVGVDPKKTLYIGLIQNARDFVATGQGYIGLRQFYPNMPKIGRPKATGAGKKRATAKRGAKQSAKRKAKPTASAAKPAAHDPAKVSAAVTEALGDHKLRSPEEVLKAVERKVGHPVKKIAVYGTLRKKDFEQVGDKYRLRQVGEGLQVEVVN